MAPGNKGMRYLRVEVENMSTLEFVGNALQNVYAVLCLFML